MQLKDIIFIILIGATHWSNAQDYEGKICGMDPQKIKVQVSDNMHPNNWGDLLTTFITGDSLSYAQKVMLYYGYVFMRDYDPLMALGYETKMILKNDSMLYREAKLLGDTLLENFPISTIGHEEMSYVYGRLNIPKKAKYHKRLSEDLLEILLSSGDGSTPEKAYMMLSYKDIYVVTQVRKMLLTGRKEVTRKNQNFIVATVFHDNQKKKIWFNKSLIDIYGKL